MWQSFRVAWASADTPDKTSKSSAARALQVEAVRGPSWQEFNAIDFSQTHVLFVSGQTPVGKLAYAVIAEVKAKGRRVSPLLFRQQVFHWSGDESTRDRLEHQRKAGPFPS